MSDMCATVHHIMHYCNDVDSDVLSQCESDCVSGVFQTVARADPHTGGVCCASMHCRGWRQSHGCTYFIIIDHILSVCYNLSLLFQLYVHVIQNLEGRCGVL